MPEPTDDADDLRARVSALEQRIEVVAADALAARHLAAANDRDYSDLAIKTDANRVAINALGEQTAARFDHLEGRFDRLEGRFDRLEGRFDQLENEMRSGFAKSAAGFRHIAELITNQEDRPEDR